MLVSFQSKLRPVGLRWFFARLIFLKRFSFKKLRFHPTSFSGFLSFFGIKSGRVTVTKLFFHFEQHMRQVTWVMVASCSKFSFNFFNRKTQYYLQNLMGYNHFLLDNKQKLLGMHIFPKITSIAKKKSSESDQYHAPVQKSRTISSLSADTKSRYIRRLRMTVFR